MLQYSFFREYRSYRFSGFICWFNVWTYFRAHVYESLDLEVLAKSGTPTYRRHAEKILPVVRNQHLLLCTLLICNAAAMEALPIFLDSLITAWGAILISVTLIRLFGEQLVLQ